MTFASSFCVHLLRMEILVAILIFALVFIYLYLSKWSKNLGIPQILLPVIFTIKCGIGVLFLYTYLYESPDLQLDNDTGTFLHEGKILNDVFTESPGDYFKLLTGIGENDELRAKYLSETDHWSAGDQSMINDNKNVIRLHSLLYFIPGGSPIVHMIIFCLVGLIGLSFIFKFFTFFTDLNKTALFLLITLLPSVLFWSSGLLKEPFLLLGLGLFLFASFCNRINWFKRAGLIIFSLIILIGFKPYVLATLVPAIIFFQVFKWMPQRKLLYTSLVLFAIVTAGIFIFSSKVDRTIHSIARKQFDFSNVGRGGVYVYADTSFYYFEPENYDALNFTEDSVELIEPSPAWIAKYGSLDTPEETFLEPTGEKWLIHFQNSPAQSFIEIPAVRTFSDLFKTAPIALFNSVLRPLPTDPGSSAKYIAFIESLMLISFLIFGILRRKRISTKQKNIVYSTIIFIVLLSLIIGWVTPVLGAIVRYRIPVQLGFLLLITLLIHPKKSKQHE